MSRGGTWLLSGIGLVVGSFCGGMILTGVAVSALRGSPNPESAVATIGTLGCFGVLLNLAFYGGLLAVVVGIVVLVVDGGGGPGGQQQQPPYHGTGYQPPAYSPPPPPGPSATVEAENRRLREELEQLRREREAGSSGFPPVSGPAPDAIREGDPPDDAERRRRE